MDNLVDVTVDMLISVRMKKTRMVLETVEIPCKWKGCKSKKKHHAKGYCYTHYVAKLRKDKKKKV